MVTVLRVLGGRLLIRRIDAERSGTERNGAENNYGSRGVTPLAGPGRSPGNLSVDFIC